MTGRSNMKTCRQVRGPWLPWLALVFALTFLVVANARSTSSQRRLQTFGVVTRSDRDAVTNNNASKLGMSDSTSTSGSKSATGSLKSESSTGSSPSRSKSATKSVKSESSAESSSGKSDSSAKSCRSYSKSKSKSRVDCIEGGSPTMTPNLNPQVTLIPATVAPSMGPRTPMPTFPQTTAIPFPPGLPQTTPLPIPATPVPGSALPVPPGMTLPQSTPGPQIIVAPPGFAPVTSPATLVPETPGFTPVTPIPSTFVPGATPLPSTGGTPAASIGATPAVTPAGSTTTTPATIIPSVGATPAATPGGSLTGSAQNGTTVQPSVGNQTLLPTATIVSGNETEDVPTVGNLTNGTTTNETTAAPTTLSGNETQAPPVGNVTNGTTFAPTTTDGNGTTLAPSAIAPNSTEDPSIPSGNETDTGNSTDTDVPTEGNTTTTAAPGTNDTSTTPPVNGTSAAGNTTDLPPVVLDPTNDTDVIPLPDDNLSNNDTISIPETNGTSPSNDTAVRSGKPPIELPFRAVLKITFFEGEGREPTKAEIEALMRETRAFFKDVFSASPIVGEQFISFGTAEVESTYDDAIDSDLFQVEFDATVVVMPFALITIDTIADIVDNADFEDFISNYVWLSEPFQRNEFYHTHEVSFTCHAIGVEDERRKLRQSNFFDFVVAPQNKRYNNQPQKRQDAEIDAPDIVLAY